MRKLPLLLILVMFATPGYAQTDTVVIKSIYFGGGSYYVDEAQKLELFELIDSFENLESFQISITSHTDNIGGAEYNQWLSKMRSEAVIQKLLLRSVLFDQINSQDFGQHNPLYSNKSWRGRINNRRVDIIFSPMLL